VAGTQSFIAKKGEVEQNWFVVDASDQIVGRLACKIATVLMGKHRPGYTAHVDTGEFVVVTNASKVVFTGNKLDLKRYTWYTGYTRLRSETAGQRLEKQPEMILREAVRRMLPKNKLGRHMLSKLKVFAGAEHTHQAQQPKPMEQAFGGNAGG
jgi:large subunit ribosomal protein L13